ncbi:hypothetical protein QYM36_019429 [Artemia franciscana]|uniref:Gp28/Gp37-like domain-containing protein n=1 Tax=Artemia franciscana TaxID=6661 RepID=A0AA88H590_ARTSF|nr:hypothetical protein QYM36_019429 [Artemia franciscana]
MGQIPDEHLPGALFKPVHRGVGVWQVTLPSLVDGVSNPLVEVLKQPRSGLVVTGLGGVIISGPMISASETQTTDDVDGSWTFEGVSDLVHVEDRVAYPSPGVEDAAAQTATNDVRTGARETLLHQYVNANAGPGAPSARRVSGLTMGTDGGAGATITKSPRFTQLLDLCRDICFITGESTDRTAEFRLDLENEQLTAVESGLFAPTLTDAIVAGQEQGVNRPDRHAIRTSHSCRTTSQEPSVSTGGLGDLVTVVVHDTEIPAKITSATISVTADGVYLGVSVGDDVATDWEAGVDSTLDSLRSRVSSLERNDLNPSWLAFTPTVEGVTDAAECSGSYLIDGNLLTYHFQIVLDSGVFDVVRLGFDHAPCGGVIG